jgi:hypothetical protein
MLVGRHNKNATAIAATSAWRYPRSLHDNCELPSICTQGKNITMFNCNMSSTSFAAPALAGTTVLVQSINDGVFKGHSEVVHAILYASATMHSVTGS